MAEIVGPLTPPNRQTEQTSLARRSNPARGSRTIRLHEMRPLIGGKRSNEVIHARLLCLKSSFAGPRLSGRPLSSKIFQRAPGSSLLIAARGLYIFNTTSWAADAYLDRPESSARCKSLPLRCLTEAHQPRPVKVRSAKDATSIRSMRRKLRERSASRTSCPRSS